MSKITSISCFVFQLSSIFCLLPSVLLTYIGQAAYLRKHMDMDISNAFFNSVPSMYCNQRKYLYHCMHMFLFFHHKTNSLMCSCMIQVFCFGQLSSSHSLRQSLEVKLWSRVLSQPCHIYKHLTVSHGWRYCVHQSIIGARCISLK